MQPPLKRPYQNDLYNCPVVKCMASAIAKRTLRTMSLVSVRGYGTWFFLIEEQL